ncbi:MAG: hypothetical protein A2445_03070 [Candidatus Jacksonbacteria bacterium RIFOXYC2_FULL_44_29]|nr:MAG: Release factor glutamine methyltransferase [Parcubacteria group bacterium GW2011_GWC2_44_22]OGY75697.1 MAG: hypothetical protein A2240_04060 [Candidatus Jacksonbacteria bacterium RIFOXYA2_FULL_43_12]OGY76172.1 MAG: hypothetical protein A2295_03540 [Candidatus Jacksonbacteria bacterium RIFOXYB2_FULL_44_15]OGY80078.1 MAG: hypothetical protein A2445_03070 [Candidatus Jacksonbacteria bacterium RIFOXYC2_FULL_44_29]OGY81737.1 MAG: hypothetical protein A2550_01040 [Candidatus Jacksonbacteria b
MALLKKNSLPTVKTVWRQATLALTNAGIPSAQLDAEILLTLALNKTKEFLYTYPEYHLDPEEFDSYKKLIARRQAHEPVAYITGKKEFYGLDFIVDRRVLIPRPETEKIVDEALKLAAEFIADQRPLYIIDVGTGSGCIIISIAKKILDPSQVELLATDISSESLAVAKLNARQHHVLNMISFRKGNLIQPLQKKLSAQKNPVLIITANLPYITPKQYRKTTADIKKYEPRHALLTPDENPNYYYQLLDNQLQNIQKKTQAQIYKFYELITDSPSDWHDI